MMKNDYSGLVLLHKPSGLTSFQTINQIKRKLKGIKVGHTGTLDKFATGLLVVMTGKLTRLAAAVTDMEKSYLAEAKLGVETDTQDPEGDIINQTEITTYSKLNETKKDFEGLISQIPPQFSALKINGQRASSRMRNGETVEMKPRNISIYSLDIVSVENDQFNFAVTCSRGTYVRSLARDWAVSAGSTAHLTSLIRTAIGPFKLENAINGEDFDPDVNLVQGRAIFDYFPDIEVVDLNDEALSLIRVGSTLADKDIIQEIEDGVKALFYKDSLMALVNRDQGHISYIFNCGSV